MKRKLAIIFAIIMVTSVCTMFVSATDYYAYDSNYSPYIDRIDIHPATKNANGSVTVNYSICDSLSGRDGYPNDYYNYGYIDGYMTKVGSYTGSHTGYMLYIYGGKRTASYVYFNGQQITFTGGEYIVYIPKWSDSVKEFSYYSTNSSGSNKYYTVCKIRK